MFQTSESMGWRFTNIQENMGFKEYLILKRTLCPKSVKTLNYHGLKYRKLVVTKEAFC